YRYAYGSKPKQLRRDWPAQTPELSRCRNSVRQANLIRPIKRIVPVWRQPPPFPWHTVVNVDGWHRVGHAGANIDSRIPAPYRHGRMLRPPALRPALNRCCTGARRETWQPHAATRRPFYEPIARALGGDRAVRRQ